MLDVWQFHLYADEIVGVSKDNALSTFGILQSISDTATSFANHEDTDWPMVTLPDFSYRSYNYLGVSGVERVVFAPSVLPTELEQWVEYSGANQGWLQEGLLFGDRHTDITAAPIRDMVWRFSETTNNPLPDFSNKPSLPIWQFHPVAKGQDSAVVNYNLRSHPKFERGIFLSESTKKVVLSEVFKKELHVLDPSQDFSTPKSVVIQPVLESFAPQAAVAGYLLVILPWNVFFKNVLAEGSSPVVCVVDNSCGDVFSYQVNGHDATFLGYYDAHNPKYDHMTVQGTFPDFSDIAGVGENILSYCEFSVTIYPSEELEAEFLDGSPIIYMLGVLAVFFLTSMVFVLYDWLVHKLKKEVVQNAQRSNAVINSLFPKEVQDRMFKAAEERKSKARAPKFALQNFLSDEEKERRLVEDPETVKVADMPFPGQVYDTKPIADLFLQCTVSFHLMHDASTVFNVSVVLIH